MNTNGFGKLGLREMPRAGFDTSDREGAVEQAVAADGDAAVTLV